MRRAKIVCTLGPASSSPQMVGGLIEAGMDVARLNFSHGDYDSHMQLIRTLRSEADKRGRAVAILQDLQGPKIRVGKFQKGRVELEPGKDFLITTRDIPGDERGVSTTYKNLPRDVSPGDTVLLDDGYLQLQVVSVEAEDIRCRVVVGGTLKDNKGINLPGVKISAPVLCRAAAALCDGYRGDLDALAAQCDGLDELGGRIAALAPGIGTATVLRFLRPLREVWSAARETPLAEPARAAALHLGLLGASEDLEGEPAALLAVCLNDLPDLAVVDVEAALERLGAAACRRSRPARCPLGAGCPLR